nr:MAG TPA: hypothetical protein [Caudoviricetes sp.]
MNLLSIYKDTAFFRDCQVNFKECKYSTICISEVYVLYLKRDLRYIFKIKPYKRRMTLLLQTKLEGVGINLEK